MKMLPSKCTHVVATLLIVCLAAGLQAQGISVDSMPPVVVRTVPQSGDTCVDSNLDMIKVTFSKDMNDQSWSLLQVSEESFPQFTGKPGFLPDKRTCVVGVHLEPNKTYALLLNSERHKNFKDAKQQSALPYLLVFKTGEK